MSTIITAVTGILILIIVIAIIIISKRKRKKKEQEFQHFLAQRLQHYHLKPTEIERQRHWLLVLDQASKKILYLNGLEESPQESLIHLSNIKNCRLVTETETFASGSNGKGESITTAIGLEIFFVNGEKATVPFYHYIQNNLFEMADLRSKATDWEKKIKAQMSSKNITTK